MVETFFCSIIQEFSTNVRKAKRALADKRLSQLERVIIESYLTYRVGKNQEALEMLESVQIKGSEFIEAHKSLLKGMIHLNLHQTEAANSNLLAADHFFQDQEFPYFSFVSKMNLFILALNLKDSDSMKKYLGQLKKLPLDKRQSARVLLLNFSYLSTMEKLAEADSVMEEIKLSYEQLSDAEISFYLVNSFCHFVRHEEFDRCDNILEEIRPLRSFHSSENFLYMRKLLDHYRSNAPIYMSDAQYKASQNLFHELKVIQSLEARDWTTAELHWRWLMNYDATTYAPNFVFKGDKRIFSLCLEKYAQEVSQRDQAMKPLFKDNGLGHVDKLRILMEKSQGPFTQNFLFESIWGYLPQDKEDLRKLSRTINRLKVKYGYELKAKRGCYHLVSNPRKKAS